MKERQYREICVQLDSSGFIDALAEKMRESCVAVFAALPAECSEAELRTARAAFSTARMVTTHLRNEATKHRATTSERNP